MQEGAHLSVSLSVLAQIASAATNLLFVVIIAIGYFMMIRLYKQMVAVYDRMLHFTEAESISLGRPLVVVYEDPQKLPNLNLVVQNVGSGPARDISFEFSDPIESSDGFVLSELPVFVEGMTSLAPGAKLTCYWDDLGNLLSQIEQGKTPRHVEVTTRYEDLSGATYETTWDIQPHVYEGIRNVDYKGINELVETVEGISAGMTISGADGREESGDPRTSARCNARERDSGGTDDRGTS
jgi:hypothetical protein